MNKIACFLKSPELLVLKGVLDVDTVNEVQLMFSLILGRLSGVVCVDLAQVVHADSAGLAWLINLVRAAKARYDGLVFANVPPNLQAMASLSGVGDLLFNNRGVIDATNTSESPYRAGFR